jgi:hypothetical protein
MTLIVARKFGQRVIAGSDTMILPTNGSPSDRIPGQLKSVVIAGSMSICFADNVERSLDAIRTARCQKLRGADIKQIFELLQNQTHGSNDSEFIVLLHDPEARLFKICDNSGDTIVSWYQVQRVHIIYDANGSDLSAGMRPVNCR